MNIHSFFISDSFYRSKQAGLNFAFSMLVVTIILFFSSVSYSSSSSLKPVVQSTTNPIVIVASIKPLALIAQDIVGDLGVVDVLVPPTSSPHDYAMKMSDARKLSKADKVIWFGGDLEQFLVKQIKGIPSKQVITIGDLGDNHIGHNDVEHLEHVDLHLWLNPHLAKQIAEKIGEALIADQQAVGNSSYAETLQKRLKQTLTNYDSLSNELELALSPVQNIGFIVYHRAYDQFANEYGLRQIGYISSHPEVPVGVKHILEIENKIAEENKLEPVKCLFVEEGYQTRVVDQVAKQLMLNLQTVDILGTSEKVNTYFDLMRGVADSFTQCLSAQ